jgi:hypothetical protein
VPANHPKCGLFVSCFDDCDSQHRCSHQCALTHHKSQRSNNPRQTDRQQQATTTTSHKQFSYNARANSLTRANLLQGTLLNYISKSKSINQQTNIEPDCHQRTPIVVHTYRSPAPGASIQTQNLLHFSFISHSLGLLPLSELTFDCLPIDPLTRGLICVADCVGPLAYVHTTRTFSTFRVRHAQVKPSSVSHIKRKTSKTKTKELRQ